MAFAATQHRFPTFLSKSPIIPHHISTALGYSRRTYMAIAYSSSNFFEKINVKEKDREKYFYYVFYNGKKNGSGIFCAKNIRNILFYYFEIHYKFDGYLFNIILIITSIITANHKRVSIVPLIVCKEKNIFDRLLKMQICDYFLIKKMEYLMMFDMVLLLLLHIKQFLLYYEYIYDCQLYMDMVWFYSYNDYNLYKKIKNIYNGNTKFLKNTKISGFDGSTKCNTSNSMIILTSKHRGMCTYFLNFFAGRVSCFIVSLMFLCSNHGILECSFWVWNIKCLPNTFCARISRFCSCTLAFYCWLLFFCTDRSCGTSV